MKKPLIIEIVAIFVLFIVSFSVVSVLTPYGSATSPDSLSYMDMAANFKNGKGVLATDFSLENQEHHGVTEQRSWPPLYPALLSISVRDYADVSAVANISKILLFISLLMSYGAIRTYTQWPVALLLSCLLSISIPIITIYTYTWSETLFVSLLAIATWISLKYLEIDTKYAIKKMILVAILTATLILLVYTRYIGVVYVILFPAIFFMSKKNKYDLGIFLAAGVVYSAGVGCLLVDNYWATGSWSGVARSVSDRNVLENIIDMFSAVKAIFPSSSVYLMSSLLISAVIVYINRKSVRNIANMANVNLAHSAIVLLLIAVSYLFALVMLRSFSNFDRIDVRLISPAFPALFMLIAISSLFFDVSSTKGSIFSFISIFLIISFSIQGYAQIVNSQENWKKHNSPMLPSNGYIKYYNFTINNNDVNQIKRLFSTLVTGHGVVVVDNPMIFRFLSGVDCVKKPENIDLGILKKINQLPEGSLFLFNKDENDHFYLLSKDHKIEYTDLGLGNVFALKIPMKFLSAN